MAFYGSTPAYWAVLEVHGLSELGRKLNVMPKAGQWEQMTAEISDEVVRLFAAVGTHDRIAGEIERRFGGAADAVAISGGYGMHQEVPSSVVTDVRRIPSVFSGYRTAW